MRIFNSEPLYRIFSGIMSDIVGSKNSDNQKIVSKSHMRQDQCFLTWPKLNVRNISTLAGFGKQPRVNVKDLEKFLQKSADIEEKYCGFMASALLKDTIDDSSEASLGKARAVQKMVQVIRSSVSDIQTITLLNISSSKG